MVERIPGAVFEEVDLGHAVTSHDSLKGARAHEGQCSGCGKRRRIPDAQWHEHDTPYGPAHVGADVCSCGTLLIAAIGVCSEASAFALGWWERDAVLFKSRAEQRRKRKDRRH